MNRQTRPPWKLQDAKNRFSELVRATEHGPQAITVRGEEKAVLVSAEDYARVRHILEKSQTNFTEFLLSIPQGGSDDEEIFERARARSRDIDF
jgi:prevent-host-death family protein